MSAVSAALGERRVPELAEFGAESSERDPVDDVVARHLLVHFGIENVIENPKQRVRRSIDRSPSLAITSRMPPGRPCHPSRRALFRWKGRERTCVCCVRSSTRFFCRLTRDSLGSPCPGVFPDCSALSLESPNGRRGDAEPWSSIRGRVGEAV